MKILPINRPLNIAMLTAIIFLLPLSGCLGPEPDLPPVGLGIEIPPRLPQPGSFLESEDDLQTLESFLREEGPQILDECGHPEGFSQVNRHLNLRNYGTAIEELFHQCNGLIIDKIQIKADEAIREGREEEIFDELQKQAMEALEALKIEIKNHSGPGNSVEAALMNRIMGVYYIGYQAVTQGAFELWEPYEDETARNSNQLQSAYMNLLNSVGRAPAIMMVLDQYPWTDPPCKAPNIDQLSRTTQEKINQTLALAYSFGESTENEEWNDHFGRLIVRIIPYFEYARDRGWWPSLLTIEGELARHIAYWENLTAPAWPTMEEGKYLLAEFRSDTRSIWTDLFIMRSSPLYFDNPTPPGYDWATDTIDGPPSLMSILAIHWPFGDLECPAQEHDERPN